MPNNNLKPNSNQKQGMNSGMQGALQSGSVPSNTTQESDSTFALGNNTTAPGANPTLGTTAAGLTSSSIQGEKPSKEEQNLQGTI